MIYVRPDYYDKFRCIASACRHSCCVGWEIDIDEDTAELYASVPGRIGGELKEHISHEPTDHFVLAGEDERCPFLRKDGLCRLIIELGEDSLCDICREHPRFYNEFSGRMEKGIGMCCEEAARLLCEGKNGTELVYEADGEMDEADPAEREKLDLRDELLRLLKEDEPLLARFERACLLCGTVMPNGDTAYWAEFYLTLERLDENWTDALERVRRVGTDVNLASKLNEIKYERMAEYFIYRHFAAAENTASALRHAIVAVSLIGCMDALLGDDSEHLRMYSSEIEYSDENPKRIYNKLENDPAANTTTEITI